MNQRLTEEQTKQEVQEKERRIMKYSIAYENSPENIIRTQIAEPLENFINGRESCINWTMVYSSVRCFSSLPEQENMVHEALKSLYWDYLCDNIPHTKEMNSLNGFLHQMIVNFEGLGNWIGEKNIMDISNELLKGKYPASSFFQKMRIFLEQGYAPYISKWDKQYIEEEIGRLAVQDERKRGELFCVMQAYHSIAVNKFLSDKERMQMYELLYEHWQYLVNVYSVMVKRIVGSGFKTFSQLVNNVNILQSCHPYIHLFYNAILLRQDDIFPTDIDKDKAVKNLTRMENIMKETPKDTKLDALCKVLFGDEFEEVMARKKQLSYDEMKQQLKEYRETIQMMERNWMLVVNQLKNAVEASVPISVIEKELLKMEPNIALSIFSQLNMLLIGEEVWTNSANEIKLKILEKRNINIEKANIHVAMVNTLENNGTLNDLDGAYIMPQLTTEAAKGLPFNQQRAE